MRTCTERGCRQNAEIGPHCERHALSPAALADQLTKTRARNATLERELAALRAQHPDHDRETVDILERIAGELATAAEASAALTAASPDPTGRSSVRRRNDQPTPGASTGPARAARRRLIAALVEACEAFETEMEAGWRRPHDGIPRVSCWRRDCPARGLKVKAWRNVRGGRTIPTERCASCGGPLAASETTTVRSQ